MVSPALSVWLLLETTGRSTVAGLLTADLPSRNKPSKCLMPKSDPPWLAAAAAQQQKRLAWLAHIHWSCLVLLLLQESRVVRVIRKQLVKRSLDMLKEIAGRPADDKGKSDYDTFYEAFGRCA